MTTYGELCEAIRDQLNVGGELEVWAAAESIDADARNLDLGPLSLMDLARFMSGVAGRMGWLRPAVAPAPDVLGYPAGRDAGASGAAVRETPLAHAAPTSGGAQ